MDTKERAKCLSLSLDGELSIKKWVVDSRLCEKGCLFVALKGAKVDGHDFLKEAADKGAVAAMVCRSYSGPSFGLTLLYVEDPLKTLQTLAARKRRLGNYCVIGVTGSVGKTTIKEFIYGLLKKHKKVDKTWGSYNGQIGLPLSIMNAKEDSDILILEMGMTYKGEMKILTEIAEPDISVISKISAVHIAFFNSAQEIALEKAEILLSRHMKAAFIHEMAYAFKEVQSKIGSFIPAIYGYHHPLVEYVEKDKTLHFKHRDGSLEASLYPVFEEKHLIENLIAAVLVARHVGIAWEDIKQDILELKPFDHRFERCLIQGVTLIDDTYNCNPLAMTTVIESLPSPIGKGRRIGIIGEMADLGQHTKKAHEEIGLKLLNVFDKVYCYGDDTKSIVDIFQQHRKYAKHFSDRSLLGEAVSLDIKPGDIVFAKGKNTNRLWEVVDILKNHLL